MNPNLLKGKFWKIVTKKNLNEYRQIGWDFTNNTNGKKNSRYPFSLSNPEKHLRMYIDTRKKSLISRLIAKHYIELYVEPNGIIFLKKKRPFQSKYPALWAIQGYALVNYNAYLETNKLKYKERFLFISDWLEKQFDITYNGWLTKYKKKPYISSLTQGRGLSVMIRAHSLTNKTKYLDVCEKLLSTFEIPKKSGGLLSIDKCGCYWYEECPSINHVLNGFITSLIGLFEYSKYSNNKKAKKLFDFGILTLKKHLQDFEINNIFFKWTRYTDEEGSFAKDSYHQMHVSQMAILYDLTEDRVFLRYYKKWQTYLEMYNRIVKLANIFYYFKKIWRVYCLKEPIFN